MRPVLVRLLGLGALLLACQQPPVAGPPQVLPSQIVEDFTLHESSSGTRLYTLKASRSYVYSAEERADLVALQVFFYDERGRVHSLLEADAGTVFSRTEDLVARGHVVVRTEDSTVLRTDSLAWKNGIKQVRTDAPVEITTPKGRVSGQGLVSDAGLSRVQILSEVFGSSDYDFETER